MLDASTLADRMGILPDQKTLNITLQNRPSEITLSPSGCVRRPVDLAEIARLGDSLAAIPTSQFLIPALGMDGNELFAGDLIDEPNGLGSRTLHWMVVHAVNELQTTIWRAYVARKQ